VNIERSTDSSNMILRKRKVREKVEYKIDRIIGILACIRKE
jgi:hypothetical protein